MKYFNHYRQTIQIGLLVLASVIIFGNTIRNEFIWDDPFLITDNLYIRDYKNIPLFFTPHYWNDLHPFPGQYRPLRTASLAVNYFFGELDPAGYRLLNVLLHAINVVLIFYLVSIIENRWSERRKNRSFGRRFFLCLPFLTALFFAIHPIHTETLNLVKNRSDLFACLFYLLSVLLFIRHINTNGRMSLLAAWFCFIPAVLSKEMALTLPGVLALYVVCFLPGSERRKALIRIAPYAVIIAIYFWFMHSFIRPADPVPGGFPLPQTAGQHVLAAIKTLGLYLKMLAVPFPLNVEQAFAVPGSVLAPSVLASLMVLLLLGVWAVKAWQRSPVILFALGWVILTLLPAANIIYLVSRPVAEQRLYIPSFGFCLLLAYGIERLSYVRTGRLRPERAVAVSGLVTMIVAGLYVGITVYRNFDWHDEITFYSKTVALNADSARIQNNLGLALSKAGKYAEAISHFQVALRLQPDYTKAHFNLAFTFYKDGQYEKALNHYRTGLGFSTDKADPGYVSVYNNMGAALLRQGHIDEAVAVFRRAIEIKPDFTDACYNLGTALEMMQNYREALALFSKVLEINPNDIQARRQHEYCIKMIAIGSGGPGGNVQP